MNCPNCSTFVAGAAAFCPNCGTPLAAAASSTVPGQSFEYGASSTAPMVGAGVPAGRLAPEARSKRVLGYLIDLVPMLLLSIIHLLPIFGWMLYGLIHVCYWLFRDINGASLGKVAMGSVILSENGSVSTTNQRIMRNLPLALPGLLGMIPFLGLFLEIAVALFVFGTEAILLLATGRRLGDRLASTMVFRR